MKQLGQRYEEQLDPANPGEWVLIFDSPWSRYWEMELSDGAIVGRTEWKNTEALIADNQEALKSSDGMRWGDGRIVASVPMNEYFSTGYAEANKQQDMKWINRFLNDRPQYRRFKGDI